MISGLSGFGFGPEWGVAHPATNSGTRSLAVVIVAPAKLLLRRGVTAARTFLRGQTSPSTKQY